MRVRMGREKRGSKLRRATAPGTSTTPLQGLGIVVLTCTLFILWLALLVVVVKMLAG